MDDENASTTHFRMIVLLLLNIQQYHLTDKRECSLSLRTGQAKQTADSTFSGN
jgi:hypothetical protein